MDSRGYGRHAGTSSRQRLITGALTLGGLAAIAVAIFNLLGSGSSAWLGWPVLLVGLLLGCSGFFAAGVRRRTTRYRPDRFDLTAFGVSLCGLGCAVLMRAAVHWQWVNLNPSVQPPAFPRIDLLPLLAVIVAVLPALIAPRAPRTSDALRAGEAIA
jgi:energy-coupling factor transport system permease protein